MGKESCFEPRMIMAKTKRPKYTLKSVRSLAKKNKGILLSNSYEGVFFKYEWKCKNGHTWNATFHNVRRGSWCGQCAGITKVTIQHMDELAKKNGGFCRSRIYKNDREKLEWECSNGHRFLNTPNGVKRGRWCRKCATIRNTDKRRIGIDKMKEIAISRGGKCLSSSYSSNDQKLKWVCSKGHEWMAVPISVMRGSWCKTCSGSLGERIVRAYFEDLFESKFPNSRPNWLMQNSGKALELDGYSKELNIAFEHHGDQHFDTSTEFIKTESVLQNRKHTDKLKRKLCEKNGIALFETREVPARVTVNQLLEDILIWSNKNRLPIKKSELSRQAILAAYTTRETSYLDKAKELAVRNGGKCISELYFNNSTQMNWRCMNGHEFKMSYGKVLGGRWCSECKGLMRIKRNIQDAISLASKNQGECLSKTFKNSRSKLKWKCKNGHIFKASYDSCSRDHWCPKCGIVKRANSQRGDFDDVKKLAIMKNGTCLSEVYINGHSKLLWKCNSGHVWEASANNVRRGTWCPKCALVTRSRNLAK